MSPPPPASPPFPSDPGTSKRAPPDSPPDPPTKRLQLESTSNTAFKLASFPSMIDTLVDSSDSEEDAVLPRKDKGKGKVREVFVPELPETVWARIFEAYFQICEDDWHHSGLMQHAITPLLLNTDLTAISLPLLYSHPVIGYSTIEPFLRSLRSPSRYSDRPKHRLVRHLTIRPSPITPAVEKKHLAQNTSSSKPYFSTMYTVHTRFPELLGHFPELNTFTLKDTLVLHQADAIVLFAGLKRIHPKKARLEIRMWDLYESPVGQDLIEATRPSIHVHKVDRPAMRTDRSVRLDGSRHHMQEAWRDALFEWGELDFPAWWLDPPMVDFQNAIAVPLPPNPTHLSNARHPMPTTAAGHFPFTHNYARADHLGNSALSPYPAHLSDFYTAPDAPPNDRQSNARRWRAPRSSRYLDNAPSMVTSCQPVSRGESPTAGRTAETTNGTSLPSSQTFAAELPAVPSSVPIVGGQTTLDASAQAPDIALASTSTDDGDWFILLSGPEPAQVDDLVSLGIDHVISTGDPAARTRVATQLDAVPTSRAETSQASGTDMLHARDSHELPLSRDIRARLREDWLAEQEPTMVRLAVASGSARESALRPVESRSVEDDQLVADSSSLTADAKSSSSTAADPPSSTEVTLTATSATELPTGGNSHPSSYLSPDSRFDAQRNRTDHLPIDLSIATLPASTSSSAQSDNRHAAAEEECLQTVMSRGYLAGLVPPPNPSSSSSRPGPPSRGSRRVLQPPAVVSSIPTDGSQMARDTGLSSYPLAHEMRGLLCRLLRDDWAPQLQALSVVAFDPLSSLVVRAPHLDFWTQVSVPHIRVHMPRGCNALAVFKGSKEVERDKQRLRRQNANTHTIEVPAPAEEFDRVVGGDGSGGDLLHESVRLFEIEVNTQAEMMDDTWVRCGSQLPPQVCRILVGTQDWRDLRIGPSVYTPSLAFADVFDTPSPSTSDFGSPTFSFASLSVDDVEDVPQADGGETYDAEAAKEQAKRMEERRKTRETGDKGDEK